MYNMIFYFINNLVKEYYHIFHHYARKQKRFYEISLKLKQSK